MLAYDHEVRTQQYLWPPVFSENPTETDKLWSYQHVLESSWNVMVHGEARGGGGERKTGEWSG
jgi:hypothetical protein